MVALVYLLDSNHFTLLYFTLPYFTLLHIGDQQKAVMFLLYFT